MLLTSVDRRDATSAYRRTLLDERFGPPASLAREQHRQPNPRPARGVAAPRCGTCLVEHDQALAEGRYPQPVRRVVLGTDKCAPHLAAADGGRG
jgi:hypothetical protein